MTNLSLTKQPKHSCHFKVILKTSLRGPSSHRILCEHRPRSLPFFIHSSPSCTCLDSILIRLHGRCHRLACFEPVPPSAWVFHQRFSPSIWQVHEFSTGRAGLINMAPKVTHPPYLCMICVRSSQWSGTSGRWAAGCQSDRTCGLADQWSGSMNITRCSSSRRGL